MNSKQQIELSLRAADLGKDVLQLVGVQDDAVARLMLMRVRDGLSELLQWYNTTKPNK